MFTHINSPLKTRLEYKFEVKASNVSLFPSIYEVDAVGIGAINNEFHIPVFAIFYLRLFQSCALASIPHKSNWSYPLLAGDPS